MKKSQGSGTLLLGLYIALALMLIALIMFERYKMEYKVEEVEDAITSSLLGAEVVDVRTIAIFGVLRFEDIDDSYDLLCNELSYNLGIDRVGNTNKFYSGNLFPEGYECVLTRTIFYEKDEIKNNWIITEFDENGGKSVSEMTANPVTPLGETVENTGVYAEFKFPLKVVGMTKWVLKGAYVNIEKQ